MKGTANVTNPVAKNKPAKRSNAPTPVHNTVRVSVPAGTKGVRPGRKPGGRVPSVASKRPANLSPKRQRTVKEPLQEAWDFSHELEEERLNRTDTLVVAGVFLLIFLVGVLIGRVI